MSYYGDGHDKGYGDGRAGEPPLVDRGGIGWAIGMGFLLDAISTEEQLEWEQGYEEGYLEGKQEYERAQ